MIYGMPWLRPLAVLLSANLSVYVCVGLWLKWFIGFVGFVGLKDGSIGLIGSISLIC
jgi:hypothetical protein